MLAEKFRSKQVLLSQQKTFRLEVVVKSGHKKFHQESAVNVDKI
jgi:hypothetical protein